MTRKHLESTFAVLLMLATVACGPAYVVREPPPPRAAVVGTAPGPGYIWAEGYWNWQGGAWVWRPGRWLLAPRPGAVWIPAHWVRGRWGRWVFVRGHWR